MRDPDLDFLMYLGYVFTGFTGARATNCVKIIENDAKIDRIDPWSAADNCAPPPRPDGCEGVGVCDPVPFKTSSNSDGAMEGEGRGSEAAGEVLVGDEQASRQASWQASASLVTGGG